jgi:mono/diheme cytochrome c family protein
MMRKSQVLLALCAATAFATAAAAADTKSGKDTLARGRYVVTTSGCNDCHTAGYPQSGGKIAEAEWLTGDTVGFSGPWGTTYPANLRLMVQRTSESAWVARARTEMRPPMPWFSLRDMTEADLRAVYRYIKSLGPKGNPAPAYAPPGQKVSTPYIEFVPKNLPVEAAR